MKAVDGKSRKDFFLSFLGLPSLSSKDHCILNKDFSQRRIQGPISSLTPLDWAAFKKYAAVYAESEEVSKGKPELTSSSPEISSSHITAEHEEETFGFSELFSLSSGTSMSEEGTRRAENPEPARPSAPDAGSSQSSTNKGDDPSIPPEMHERALRIQVAKKALDDHEISNPLDFDRKQLSEKVEYLMEHTKLLKAFLEC